MICRSLLFFLSLFSADRLCLFPETLKLHPRRWHVLSSSLQGSLSFLICLVFWKVKRVMHVTITTTSAFQDNGPSRAYPPHVTQGSVGFQTFCIDSTSDLAYAGHRVRYIWLAGPGSSNTHVCQAFASILPRVKMIKQVWRTLSFCFAPDLHSQSLITTDSVVSWALRISPSMCRSWNAWNIRYFNIDRSNRISKHIRQLRYHNAVQKFCSLDIADHAPILDPRGVEA